ncbi:hypothetical protein [Bacillus kexueae]|uniref:hypothetical protein n=1 Tax=Aeribacillus kexueae TaxID=2078952 RepID=UPI001FAF6EBF|nr:hypothetical protein [Bacillus kexueae]
MEWVKNFEEFYIILYAIIILFINLDYLREFPKIKKGMNEISSDKELELNPSSKSVMFFILTFNFFRRWMIYLLAVLLTENVVVLIISAMLFIIGLYDSLFHYSVDKVKKAMNFKLFLSIADTIYSSVFIIYLLMK